MAKIGFFFLVRNYLDWAGARLAIFSWFYWIHTPIYPDLGVLVEISIGLGDFFTGEGIVLCYSVRNSGQTQMAFDDNFFYRSIWYRYMEMSVESTVFGSFFKKN